MTPLFSIITVTFNAAHTIERTVRSVASQTCDLYEHIIMDGASSDDTLKLAAAAGNEKMRIFSKKDNGVYYGMNNGLDVAKGDYVIFLNAGDKFHSRDTLQKMADAIMANDYPGIVYGQTDIVDDSGAFLGPRHLTAPAHLTLDSFKRGMVVCHQACAVLRRITGYFNVNYLFSADYEWMIICLQHSRHNVYVGDVLIDYLSEGVTTSNHKKSLIERFGIMCKYYGTIPTICRHLAFIPRYLKRRSSAPNRQ
ncbi:MAG: glycosyltransferase [Clostridium sp.]|nr:glycosyltransferase [Clostridium sp.]